MADRLTLTRAFESAGINTEAAERIATEVYDAIHDNVATKNDLEHVETALRADIAQVRSDLEHKIDTMVNRVVAAIVVAIGILFAALHYWPPHT
jgi:hypothetical protein